jgi:hypothetical protein
MLRRFACRKIAGLLWNGAAGRLAADERERVEAHLRHCPACRARWDEYRQTVQMMQVFRERPLPSSATTWQDLRLRLEAQATSPMLTRRPLRAASLAWGGVCLAALTLALLAGMRWRYAGLTPPDVAQRHSPPKAELVTNTSNEEKETPPKKHCPPDVKPPLPEKRLVWHAPKTRMARAGNGHRGHHRRRWRLPLRTQPEREIAKRMPSPQTPAAPAPFTMAFSVDGDRPPTEDTPPTDYVLTLLEAPITREPPRQYVMGSVAFTCDENRCLAPSQEETEEMRAW